MQFNNVLKNEHHTTHKPFPKKRSFRSKDRGAFWQYKGRKRLGTDSALLALADASHGKVCFVVRDYGVFMTTPEHAQTVSGKSIPPDSPYFVQQPVVSALIPVGDAKR